MTSVAHVHKAGQLTLDFEPSLPERFNSLREYVGHRVQLQRKPAKTIAGDMDLSPSTLSRKLAPAEGDTQRFNCDDLEAYIRSTGDTAPIEYLIAKYLQTDDQRRARLMNRVESMIAELSDVLPALRAAA